MTRHTIAEIAEHIIASGMAVIVVFLVWVSFFAEPLQIKAIAFDKPSYKPGQTFIVKAKGYKPWWSARFCKATRSTVFMRDADGIQAQSEEPFNFNPGGRRKVATRHSIPKAAQHGTLIAHKAVEYTCWRIFNMTVRSKQFRTIVGAGKAL